MFSKDGNTKDVKTPRICDVVWHDGEFIKWNDARVHVMSHVFTTAPASLKASDVTPPNRDQPFSACANTCSDFSTPQRSIAWTTRGRSISCATPPVEFVRAQRDGSVLHPADTVPQS